MLFVYDSGEAVSLFLSLSLYIFCASACVGVVALVWINSVFSFLQSIYHFCFSLSNADGFHTEKSMF